MKQLAYCDVQGVQQIRVCTLRFPQYLEDSGFQDIPTFLTFLVAFELTE